MAYRYLSTDQVGSLRSRLRSAAEQARGRSRAIRRIAASVGTDAARSAVRLEELDAWCSGWEWDLAGRLFVLAGAPPEPACPPVDLWLGALPDERLYEGRHVGRYLSALITPPRPGEDGQGVLDEQLLVLRRESRLLRETIEQARRTRAILAGQRGAHDLSDELDLRLSTGDLEQFLERRGRGSAEQIRELLDRLPQQERRIALAMVLEHAHGLGYGEDAVERSYLRESLEPIVDAVLDDHQALLDVGFFDRRALIHGLTVLHGDRDLTAHEMVLVFGEAMTVGGATGTRIVDRRGSTWGEVLDRNGVATGEIVGAVHAPTGAVQTARDVAIGLADADAGALVDIAVEESRVAVSEAAMPVGEERLVGAGVAVGIAATGFTTRLDVLLDERERRRREEDEERCDASPRPPSPGEASRPR